MEEEDVTLCAHCQQAPYKGCNGRGFIIKKLSKEGPDWTSPVTSPCPRVYVREIKEHMGSEIASATSVKNSPLYFHHDDGQIDDLTKKSLAIQGVTWEEFAGHLKWVFYFKGLQFRCSIVTDERLLSVYLGKEDFRSRPKSMRHEMTTYNGIADLVGKDFHLVIIRVGFLGYKNIAAPGILKEALLHRAALNRPTWVFADARKEWRFSADSDVARYIAENFEAMELEGDETYVPPVIEDVSDFDVEEIAGQVEAPQLPARSLIPYRETEEIEEEVSKENDLMNDPALFGSPKKGKKKWGKR